MGHRRADLADDDAGREIGEPRRIEQAEPGAERGGKGRDRRIAGAGDVIDLARCRGQRVNRAVGLDEDHAVLAERHEDGAESRRI